jgi:hypothetical protein
MGATIRSRKKNKKKKPSMAERLKKRHSKARGAIDGGEHISPFADLPRTVLDSQEQQPKPSTTTKSDAPIRVKNPTAAAEKAKELLRAQRESVNMLTFVKDRIVERISSSSGSSESSLKVMDELQQNGFAVIDNFLNDENILKELEAESIRMMAGHQHDDKSGYNTSNSVAAMMEVDSSNLGSGEFITSIQGGDEQYTVCPRTVEFVVSSTKNIPEVFNCNNDNNEDKNDGTLLQLDPSACMATLRCFDRKALKASLALLTGKDDDSVLDETYKNASFDAIVKNNIDDNDDQRRLSLFYYILPETWNNNYDGSATNDGGGFAFESSGAIAAAKRDRLVLVLSNKTKCKKIPWKGHDDHEGSSANLLASSIELHLIQRR